jgi:hypothetical protein
MKNGAMRARAFRKLLPDPYKNMTPKTVLRWLDPILNNLP